MSNQDLKRFPAQTVAGSQARGARGRYLAQARALDVFMPDAIRQWTDLDKAIGKVQDDVFLEFSALTQVHLLLREIDRKGIEGDIVECGVYRGGSAAILGYALRRLRIKRHLWLFDSFQGLPKPSGPDGPDAARLEGDVVGDEANVRRLLRRNDAPMDRVHIIGGWFRDTFPNAPVGRVALLHIDVDWYESYKACLDRFYDALEPGGVVILDDYEYKEFPGCKAALDEFIRARSLAIELKHTGRAPPFFYKPK